MTATTVQAQRVAADGALQTFNFLADQYFDDVYFRFSPTSGTAAGLHQYDTQLEDYSAAIGRRGRLRRCTATSRRLRRSSRRRWTLGGCAIARSC